MGKITPFNQQSPEQWRQQNEEVLQKFHDDASKGIINGVLNLHELEQTGEWKHLGRRLDYFDELKRDGLESVLKRLKRLKKEPNPLLERRLKRRK
jgi:hypothetical protein